MVRATRRNSKTQEPAQKSRVDWRRTRRSCASQLLDSDDDLGSEDLDSDGERDSDESADSEEELAGNAGLDSHQKPEEEGTPELITAEPGGNTCAPLAGEGCGSTPAGRSPGSPGGAAGADPEGGAGLADGAEEEERVRRGRRRRSSVLWDSEDSEGSEGSDVLVRKAGAKRPRRVVEDEGPAEAEAEAGAPREGSAAARRREQLRRLRALSEQRAQRRRGRGGAQVCGASLVWLLAVKCYLKYLMSVNRAALSPPCSVMRGLFS